MYCRYQNNDQSVSLIPKQDPGIPRITNFSIPDHYIPAMTPAPVSLVLSDPRSVCRFLDIFNLISLLVVAACRLVHSASFSATWCVAICPHASLTARESRIFGIYRHMSLIFHARIVLVFNKLTV